MIAVDVDAVVSGMNAASWMNSVIARNLLTLPMVLAGKPARPMLKKHATSREIWADPARRLLWQEGQITLKAPVEEAAGQLWPGEAAEGHP